MNKAVIVFSGFNQRAVVAFIRTLEKSNVNYCIIASSKEDPIFLTTYRRRVLATRIKRELDLEDISNCISDTRNKLGADRILIAPSTEALNRFLLKHRPDFEELNCFIPLVEHSLYEEISDKYSFGKLCQQNAILVPEEYTANRDKNVKIPCVAKPNKYVSSDGLTHSPVLILSADELMKFFHSYNPEDFYFQEYIGGDSLYLLYYFYDDGEVMKYSQKNLMQQPEGKSIVAARSFDIHMSEESDKYEQLFKSKKFTGLVMIEVKFLEGKYYMIEANPRFWGPSQLFVDAGVNLFEALLFDNKISSEKPVNNAPSTVEYFWYGGIVPFEGTKEKITYHSYSEEEYISNKLSWLHNDVYNREDTLGIFNQETRNQS